MTAELMDLSEVVVSASSRIVLLVMDGLGGLPVGEEGKTELEAARTPNLDALLREGGCGLHEPVGPGITPGSGPGHLGLFGYDPLRYRIGRGVLEALGVDFDLRSGDVAARGNLCTVDAEGRVIDRRAGRISTEEAAAVCERLRGIELEGATAHVEPVKEHRFLLVLRPEEGRLSPEVEDTDPQATGVVPREAAASGADGEATAALVRRWVQEAAARLSDEERANMVLLRGFASRPDWPLFPRVFGLRSVGLAAYPMYRGVARLVGMDVREVGESPEDLVGALDREWETHDFFFLHVKATDKAGEDGDFDRKVAAIEAVDGVVPSLVATGPDVMLVTGDHSTPSALRSHSWHPVPFLLYGGPCRAETARSFGERECAGGVYGRRRACELMPLALAQARRLTKFGA